MGKIVFIYPFGLCVNFVNYDTDVDFRLKIYNNHNYSYENMFVHVNDPAMLTCSSIDLQSQKGSIVLRKGYFTYYDIAVVLKLH